LPSKILLLKCKIENGSDVPAAEEDMGEREREYRRTFGGGTKRMHMSDA